MSTLEKELTDAGLVAPVRKTKKFEVNVCDLHLSVVGQELDVTTDEGEVGRFSIQDVVKISEALRDALATMISNNRHNF